MNINEVSKNATVRKSAMALGAVLIGAGLFWGGTAVGSAPIAEKDRVIAEQTSRADTLSSRVTRAEGVAYNCYTASATSAEVYNGKRKLDKAVTDPKIGVTEFMTMSDAQKSLFDKGERQNQTCWNGYDGLKGAQQ